MSKKAEQLRFYGKIRSIYQLKRSRHKRKQRNKKRINQRGPRFSNKYSFQSRDYYKIELPQMFSLIEKPNELLYFIKHFTDVLNKGIPVQLDLSRIKHITPEAIAILIAILKIDKYEGVPVKGNVPVHPSIREMLIRSGFYDYVSSPLSFTGHIHKLYHQKSNKRVRTKIAKEACLVGLRHTFGNEDIFEPLYEILIECMSNTHNHADVNKDGVYDWWLYTYLDTMSNTTYYSFFDLGVGIFESIPVKNFRTVFRDLGLLQNIDLVESLYEGEIKSRTGLPERGKGVPQIYDYRNHPNIKNLTLISNDVYSNMESGNKITLEVSFPGTFYYLELKN